MSLERINFRDDESTLPPTLIPIRQGWDDGENDYGGRDVVVEPDTFTEIYEEAQKLEPERAREILQGTMITRHPENPNAWALNILDQKYVKVKGLPA